MMRILKSTEISNGVDETVELGERLAGKLKAGDVVALIGDLGSGKTVFTKGIAKGLGVKDVRYVNSPTFVIIKEYRGRIPLYHLDIYRLNEYNVLDSESYKEYFYGDGVTVIEWAGKIRDLLPKGCIEVKISIAGEGKRKIEMSQPSRSSPPRLHCHPRESGDPGTG